MMTDMEIESLDYKLSRLKPGISTCIKPGEWAYLALDGSLHKLKNDGYYSPWKRDMWTSSYWLNDGRWGMGEIAPSKKVLIFMIEGRRYSVWKRGFGRGGMATDEQERLA